MKKVYYSKSKEHKSRDANHIQHTKISLLFAVSANQPATAAPTDTFIPELVPIDTPDLDPTTVTATEVPKSGDFSTH